MANAVFRVGLLFVLSRMLEPVDFGIFQVITLIFSYINVISNLGMASALVQRNDLTQSHMDTAFWTSMGISLLLSIFIFLAAPHVADFFHQPLLTFPVRLISCLPLIQTFSAVSRAMLLKQLRIRDLSFMEVTSYLVGYIPVTLILAYNGFGYWSLIAGFFLQALLTSVMSFRAFPFWPAFRLSGGRLKELLSFGLRDTANGLIGMTINQSDTFFIGRYMNPVSLGMYNRAYNLVAANIMLFSDFIDRIFFAGFSKKQNDDSTLLSAFYRAEFLIFVLMLPLSLFCYVNGDLIIELLLGPKWLTAATSFRILSLGLLFRLNHKLGFSILKAKGKMKPLNYLLLFNLCLTILLMFFFRDYGINGIAFAFLISLLFRYIHLMTLVKKYISGFSFKMYFTKNFQVLWCGLIYGGVVYFLSPVLKSFNLFPEFLLQSGVFIICFLPMLFHREVGAVIAVLKSGKARS